MPFHPSSAHKLPLPSLFSNFIKTFSINHTITITQSQSHNHKQSVVQYSHNSLSKINFFALNTMDTIKNTVNQGLESLQGTSAEAKKEGNKEIAKDSNLGVGDRASAAKDALGNKVDETKHDTKSEGYKHAK